MPTVNLTKHPDGYLVNEFGERVDEYGRLTRARGARGGQRKREADSWWRWSDSTGSNWRQWNEHAWSYRNSRDWRWREERWREDNSAATGATAAAASAEDSQDAAAATGAVTAAQDAASATGATAAAATGAVKPEPRSRSGSEPLRLRSADRSPRRHQAIRKTAPGTDDEKAPSNSNRERKQTRRRVREVRSTSKPVSDKPSSEAKLTPWQQVLKDAPRPWEASSMTPIPKEVPVKMKAQIEAQGRRRGSHSRGSHSRRSHRRGSQSRGSHTRRSGNRGSHTRRSRGGRRGL